MNRGFLGCLSQLLGRNFSHCSIAQVLEIKSNFWLPTVTPNPEHRLGRTLDPGHFGKMCLATQLLCSGSRPGLE